MIDEKKLLQHLNDWAMQEAPFTEEQNRDEYDVIMECIKAVEEQPKSDWIPCEERLPENLEQVLVWYEYFRYGEYNCMYETYGIGYHLDGFWSGDVSGHKARCIAWQPLPKEYKKEGAE